MLYCKANEVYRIWLWIWWYIAWNITCQNNSNIQTYRSGKSANLTLSVIDKYALNNIKSETSDVFNAFFKIFVFNVRKTSEPVPFRKLEISLSAIEVDFPYLGTELNAVVTIYQWHNACSTRQYRWKENIIFTSIQDLKFVFKKCVNPKMKRNLDSQITVSIG